MVISFEQLPQAVSQLCEDMAIIKELLSKKQTEEQKQDQWFDIDELSSYTRLSKPTIYGKKDIPCHKQGKRLMYLKSEIDIWLKTGRKITPAIAAADADTFISNSKKARA